MSFEFELEIFSSNFTSADLPRLLRLALLSWPYGIVIHHYTRWFHSLIWDEIREIFLLHNLMYFHREMKNAMLHQQCGGSQIIDHWIRERKKRNETDIVSRLINCGRKEVLCFLFQFYSNKRDLRNESTLARFRAHFNDFPCRSIIAFNPISAQQLIKKRSKTLYHSVVEEVRRIFHWRICSEFSEWRAQVTAEKFSVEIMFHSISILQVEEVKSWNESQEGSLLERWKVTMRKWLSRTFRWSLVMILPFIIHN